MNNNTKQNTTSPLMYTSKTFNRDYICRVDGTIGGLTLHTAVGYNTMLAILGDTAEKVFARLERNKAEKLAVRPFHGLTITYYRH